jgi:hypothetical protein
MMNIPDTFGWDTVFAISIEKVNEYLANLPASDAFSAQNDVTGGTTQLDWTFENWRITDIPAGSKIEVTLDFGEGSKIEVTRNGETTTTAVESPAWSCVVIFEAHFDATDPTTQRLVAKTEQGQAWASVRVETEVDNTPLKIALQSALVKWFREAPEATELFEQEFAAVNVGDIVAGDTVASSRLPWLKPRVLAYAGGVMADQVTRALGILAMTGDDLADAQVRASQVTLQLSPYAIPANAASGFIISARLFLRHMLMPACAGAFGGDEQDPTKHFEIYGDGSLKLRNHRALEFTQELKGAPRAAQIEAEDLNFGFEGDKLRMGITPMNVATDTAGFSLNASSAQAYVAILVEKSGAPGETVFLLANDEYNEPQVEVVVAPGVRIAQGVAELVVLALTVVLAVVSFKGPFLRKLGLDPVAAKIWARVAAGAIGVVGTVLVGIPNYIEWALQGEVHKFPDFSEFLNKGYLDRIAWPGNDAVRFTPTAVQFANGLQITIEPA